MYYLLIWLQCTIYWYNNSLLFIDLIRGLFIDLITVYYLLVKMYLKIKSKL